MSTEKLEFIWMISDFSKVRKSQELLDQRQRFIEIGNKIGFISQWRFRLAHVKQNEAEPNHKSQMGLYIKLEAGAKYNKTVSGFLHIKIERNDGSEFADHSTPFRISEGEEYGWDCVIPRNTTLVALGLRNRRLLVKFELTVFTPEKTELVTGIQDYFMPKFLEKLKADLRTTGVDDFTSLDTTIVSKDQVELVVDRRIISARCPVFGTMFQHNMQESRTGIIKIDDLHSKTISVLIGYIYNGKLEEGWNNSDVLYELVYAAKKYMLDDLLDFLDQIVGKICNQENLGKFRRLARILGMKTALRELSLEREMGWELKK